jgi:hypothetical protein
MFFMGRTFHFECPQCHYRAKISGGSDSGVHCEIQTVVCRDCRELLDVFTKARRRKEEKNSRAVKFPGFYRPEIPPVILRNGSVLQGLVWQKYRLACPVAPKHQVEAWNAPGRCPRCGNFMEKEGMPTKIWD